MSMDPHPDAARKTGRPVASPRAAVIFRGIPCPQNAEAAEPAGSER